MGKSDTLTIQSKIHILRKQRVMLDFDLADIFGVETRALNQAVKRNIARFPDDFMFQLTKDEFENLKSQIVTSSWGGTRKLPYAFTEHGVLMLANVLSSETAVNASIQIVRVFVKMREIFSQQDQMAKRLDAIEKRLTGHDKDIQAVFKALREILGTAEKDNKKRIGF